MQVLCNGDPHRPLRIDVFDYESSGRHQYMGSVETSVDALMNCRAPMNIIEADKQKKSKSYVNSGTLTIANPQIELHPTLSDVRL